MKKFLALLLAGVMTLGLAACGSSNSSSAPAASAPAASAPAASAPSEEPIKIGLICVHDINSGYDAAHIEGLTQACKDLGIDVNSQVVFKYNIPEDETCKETAVDLADSGCDIVFADSFGHEDYLIEAAKEFPEVQFCHATGTKAHTEGLDNFHNAFASIYEGRYLAGVAAGLKLNEMIEAGQFTAEEAKMG